MTEVTCILRHLPLPEDVAGSLWLASMPGRFESLTDFLAAAEEEGATGILCLVTDQEIDAKSPDYAHARRAGNLSLSVKNFPIPDFGVPEDKAAFVALIIDFCEDLCKGKRMIIHCAAGIGRTGLFAQQVLMALGAEPRQACDQVTASGSGPESAVQKEFCETPVVLFPRT